MASKSNWTGQEMEFVCTLENNALVGTNDDFTIRYENDKAIVQEYNLEIDVYQWANDCYEAVALGLSRTACNPLVAAFQIAYNLI